MSIHRTHSHFDHPVPREYGGASDVAFWGLTAVNASIWYIAATAVGGAVLGYALGNARRGGKVAAVLGVAGAAATAVYTYKTGQKVKAKYEKLEDELADVKKKYNKVASDLKAVTGGARNTTENVSDIIDVVADTARKFVPSS